MTYLAEALIILGAVVLFASAYWDRRQNVAFNDSIGLLVALVLLMSGVGVYLYCKTTLFHVQGGGSLLNDITLSLAACVFGTVLFGLMYLLSSLVFKVRRRSCSF